MRNAIFKHRPHPVEDYEIDLRFADNHLDAMNSESGNIALVVAVVVACLFSAAVGAAAVTWMTAHNAERVAQ